MLNYNQQVHKHTKHVGIYGQWIGTWNPAPDSNEIAVILEDDLTVSRHFYQWLLNVHRKYDDRTDLAGYALQGRSMKHGGAAGNLRGPDKDVCFMYPILGICLIQDQFLSSFSYFSLQLSILLKIMKSYNYKMCGYSLHFVLYNKNLVKVKKKMCSLYLLISISLPLLSCYFLCLIDFCIIHAKLLIIFMRLNLPF